MLIKNKFQFLVVILMSAIVGGILLIFLIIDLQNRPIVDPSYIDPEFNETNAIVDTYVAATITAKGYTDTPN